jgi:hypothetical protein
MDSFRSQQLEQIIVLSRQMLDRARDSEWARVAELEDQRKQLVARCFQQATSGQDAPEVAASIREILSLNDQITALGSVCRDRLGGEIHTHKVGRSASAAYLSHAR